jgi:hypothetical protein
MLIPGFSGSGAPAVLSAARSEAAQQKALLHAESYPSQAGRGRLDHETFLGLMRVRGVPCRANAEAFTVEKALLETESDYSLN